MVDEVDQQACHNEHNKGSDRTEGITHPLLVIIALNVSDLTPITMFRHKSDTITQRAKRILVDVNTDHLHLIKPDAYAYAQKTIASFLLNIHDDFNLMTMSRDQDQLRPKSTICCEI